MNTRGVPATASLLIIEQRAFWIAAASGAMSVLRAGAVLSTTVFARQQQQPASSVLKDNEELTKLFSQVQSDRMPQDGKPVDWAVVVAHDQALQAR